MYNYFMLIGRLEKKKVLDDGSNNITLKCIDTFKDENGNYNSKDYHISCPQYVYDAIENVELGEPVGIKGHIEPNPVTNMVLLVADRVIHFMRGGTDDRN